MLLSLRSLWEATSSTDVLAAAPVGVGGLAGSLSVTHYLTVAPIGVGLASCAVSVAHHLISVPVGTGMAVGAVTVVGATDALSASLVGVGLATGSLSELPTSSQPQPGGPGPRHRWIPPRVNPADFMKAPSPEPVVVKRWPVPALPLALFAGGYLDESEFLALLAAEQKD